MSTYSYTVAIEEMQNMRDARKTMSYRYEAARKADIERANSQIMELAGRLRARIISHLFTEGIVLEWHIQEGFSGFIPRSIRLTDGTKQTYLVQIGSRKFLAESVHPALAIREVIAVYGFDATKVQGFAETLTEARKAGRIGRQIEI